MNVTVEVDPEKIPYGDDGLPGSILDIALANGIEVDHSCGGVCACSTCHCIVREGRVHPLGNERCGRLPAFYDARGLTPMSRLSCQSVPDGLGTSSWRFPHGTAIVVRERSH